MSTIKLIIGMFSFAGICAFLFLFLPWSLNANNSFLNGLGAATIFSLVVGVAVWINESFMKSNTKKEQ